MAQMGAKVILESMGKQVVIPPPTFRFIGKYNNCNPIKKTNIPTLFVTWLFFTKIYPFEQLTDELTDCHIGC